MSSHESVNLGRRTLLGAGGALMLGVVLRPLRASAQTKLRIGVIGSGHIGGTIGERWAKAGHEVIYGLRDPSKRGDAKPIGQALDGAEAVLLAIPASATVDFVREHAKALAGKIIIDATNNFRAPKFNAWPELTAAVPTAQLYRAFNSLGWDVLANPIVGGVQADLLYCGAEDTRAAGNPPHRRIRAYSTS